MNEIDRAHEIRKFEIDLYWRRTTYFWTLIAAAFVAFFAIQSAKDLPAPTRSVLSFVVANLGLVFSIGWFFINRGSKFWQQNWEMQVDRLEKHRGENLYRLVLYRPHEDCWLVDPAPFSVSKINQITSFYVVVVWAGLIGLSMGQWFGLLWPSVELPFVRHGAVIVFFLLMLLSTCFVCLLFYCKARTHLKDKGSEYKYCVALRTPTRVKSRGGGQRTTWVDKLGCKIICRKKKQ